MSSDKLPHDPDLFRRVLELRATDQMGLRDIAQKLRIDSRYITPLLRDAIKWLLAENQTLAGKTPAKVVKSDIEQRLLTSYPHLKDVFVVSGREITANYEYDRLVGRWGKMAADYVDAHAYRAAAAGRELHVCMSGGETILELVNSFRPEDRGNVFFYASALIGRPHMASSSHVDAIANATIAWSRSGRIDGRCIYATVNPYDLSDAGRAYGKRKETIRDEIDALSAVPSIGTYLKEDLMRMDVAIAGLGMVIPPKTEGIRANRLTASNLLESITQIQRADLSKDGAIGEIGYCYFDSKGKDDEGKWRFYLTAGDHDKNLRGVGFYREMVRRKRDVIVCAGAFKEPAIIAALEGQLFNVWFTNEEAAITVLDAR